MNRSQLKKFEIRLGIIQAVSLVAIVLGFLGGAFFLGFSSGKTTGHDLAYQSSIATSARIPLAPKSEKSTSAVTKPQVDVYANLQGVPKSQIPEEQKPVAALSGDKAKEPEVSTIPEVKIPLDPIEDRVAAKIPSTDVLKNDSKQQEKQDLLGGPSLLETETASNSHAIVTLGDVAPKALEGAVPLHNDQKLNTNVIKQDASKSPDPAKTTSDTTVGRVVFSEPPKLEQIEPVQKIVPPKEELLKKEEAPKELVPPKVQAEKPIVPPSTKGWFAQVAAPQKSADAQLLSTKLRASGFKVTIENATVRGEQYFRVLVGPEGSIDQAQRLVEQLKRESYLQSQPFVRLVK